MEIFGKLQEMINENAMDPRPGKPEEVTKNKKLYMPKYYNIHHFTSAIGESVMARVVNATIDGMNKHHHLPRYLIVLLDIDMIHDLNIYEFGVHKGLALTINWLAKQLDLLMNRKRMQNLEKRPASVQGSNPTIIFVTMIKRLERYPEGSKMAWVCTLRNKFNELLNESAARTNAKILSIHNCTSPDDFDHFGKLSRKGRLTFWLKLDDLLQRFEENKVKLIPKVEGTTKYSGRDNRKPKSEVYKVHNYDRDDHHQRSYSHAHAHEFIAKVT